jgi:hydroxypyruvate reductase
MSATHRRILLGLFERTLAAVHGRARTRAAAAHLPQDADWRVFAIGKAASAMTLGALDCLGPRIIEALVVSKDGHFDAELEGAAGVTCLASAHPVPDERSLAAGAELLRRLARLRPDERVLFLVSGGASSLIEALPQGVTLPDLKRVNEWGLSIGLDIVGLNRIRKTLSLIKGGRLLGKLSGVDVHALFISDVPGDDPSVIGSGILGAPEPAIGPGRIPAWVQTLMKCAQPATIPEVLRIERRVIAKLDDALDAARAAAEDLGLTVAMHPQRFAGDARNLAVAFAHELVLSAADLNVWGGESTVELPAEPGRGGRNQQLALAAARLLAGHDDLAILAAGTDGTDGPTADAGALVDGSTLDRGTIAGLDAEACLARCDAGSFLEASGDLVSTGPSGTNVGDLVLGLRMPRELGARQSPAR